MAQNDILSPKFMLEVVRQIPVSRNYIGGNYFPTVPVSTEELTWDLIKDEQALAGLYSIDGRIVPGSEAIYGQMFADICRIAASRQVRESEYRKLRDPGMIGIERGVVADIRAEVERKVARKLADCRREVDATIEYLQISALQGYIPWPPVNLEDMGKQALGNAKFSIDYNFPSTHKILASDTDVFGSGAALWSDTSNCQPWRDLMILQEKMEDEAGVPADAIDIIMARRVIRLMGESTKMQDKVKYTSIEGMLSYGQLQAFLGRHLGPGVRLIVYNGMYTYREEGSTPDDITIKQVRILPTNKIIIVPRGLKLGDFATSPAQPNNWAPGLFTWRKEEENPWRVEIGVGINGFPRVIHPEAIFVLQVEADAVPLPDKK